MKTKEEHKWELPEYFKDNFENIGLDFFKLVFEQSEHILTDKLQTGENITQRAFVTVGIASSTLALSCGFLAGNAVITDYFKIALILESALCFITLILLVNPILSRVVGPLGSSPKNLLHPEYISSFPTADLDKRNELVIKNLYLSLCQTNQSRITFNEAQNLRRVKKVDKALILLSSSPLLSLIIALIACNALD